jgi:hypothetical protein
MPLAKLPSGYGLCQGTALVEPQMPQDQQALQAAERGSEEVLFS